MNKGLLETFIKKYHLGGEMSEPVAWVSKDKTLHTRFISEDKSVLGEILLKKIDLEDMEVGIYTTDQLVKLISVLESNSVELKVGKKDGKDISLEFNDSTSKVNYMLADLSVIPTVPDLKELPDFDITINLSAEFMSRFIKAKNALPDVNTYTLITDSLSGSKIVIGYSTINSNRISLDVDAKFEKEADPMSFPATYLKEIFLANREADSAVLKVSSEGLSYIKFDVNEFSSEYYLVEVTLGT